MSHDLTALARLVEPPLRELEKMQTDLDTLSRMAVQIRYPGFDANADNARRALHITEQIRRICRSELGMKD